MSIQDKLKELIDIVEEKGEVEIDSDDFLEEDEIVEESEEVPAPAAPPEPSEPDSAEIPMEELRELMINFDKKNRLVAEFAQISLQYENAKESLLSLLKISENEIKDEIFRIRQVCDLPTNVKYHLSLPTQDDPFGRFTKVED